MSEEYCGNRQAGDGAISGCFGGVGHEPIRGGSPFVNRLPPTDFIGLVSAWNKDAGNTTDHFNPRQVALYTGMQCEELAEKLVACGLPGIAADLDRVGHELKSGVWDSCIRDGNRADMLDADCDIMVVTIGSAISQGADFPGAMTAVVSANEAKRFPDGQLHKDANGKIVKPEGWKPRDLKPYLAKE